MKRIFIYFSFALLMLMGMQASAQVIDLSTGINGGLIPLASADDTWTVCPPGSNPALPGSYIPVYCGTGSPAGWGGSTPYSGLDASVRWLSPDMNASGEHLSTSPMGDYYYKMVFDLDPDCTIKSAVFNFARIGADDQINQIIVNGNIHVVAYGFTPLASGVTLPIPTTDLVPGANTILMRVYNWGNASIPLTLTGLQINGNLTITTGPDASFCLTAPTSSTMVATANGTGYHNWEIYSSGTGNQGSYTYIGSFGDYPSLYLSGAGPCYLIKHKLSNECGDACVAQSVCHQECDDEENGECSDLTPPTNLTFNSATNLLSWTPVPGASSYTVEITINDPNCCRATGDKKFNKFTIRSNTHVIDWGKDLGIDFKPTCFSWRVIANCPNGSSAASELKCGYPGSGGFGTIEDTNPGAPAKTTGSKEATKADNAMVSVFPNPAKGTVSIDLITDKETIFSVTISDESGRMVKTFENLKTSGNKYSLKWNTESVGKGIYLVKTITRDNKIIVNKLVVE